MRHSHADLGIWPTIGRLYPTGRQRVRRKFRLLRARWRLQLRIRRVISVPHRLLCPIPWALYLQNTAMLPISQNSDSEHVCAVRVLREPISNLQERRGFRASCFVVFCLCREACLTEYGMNAVKGH